MNFKEWQEKFYKSNGIKYNIDTHTSGELAWNSCKKEIIKILKNGHKTLNKSVVVDNKVLEEIEKL